MSDLDVDLEWVIAVSDDVACELFDDEAVLLDEATGRLLQLDRLGTLVFRCFDGASPLSEIIGDLAAVFDVPTETVASDVSALLRQLLSDGIVLVAGDTPPAAPLQPTVLPNPPHR